MLILVAAVIVAGAVVWAAQHVAAATAASRGSGVQERALQILGMFAPAVRDSARDPRAFVAWHPLAATARRMCPEEFAAIERSAGGSFPFSQERLQAAHAQWTAEWLAWERAHDIEYKLKAVVAQDEIESSGGSAAARARLEIIESEKLDSYQRRYEEYIRVARALQSLIGT